MEDDLKLLRDSMNRLEGKFQVLSDKVDNILEIRISLSELSAQVTTSMAIVSRLEDSNKERGVRLGAIENAFEKRLLELKGEMKSEIDIIRHRPEQQIATRVSGVVTQVITLVVACIVGFILSKFQG